MGTLAVQGPSGHVEIKWEEDCIDIDLNPTDGKANERERDRVLQIVTEAISSGFSGKQFTKKDSDGSDLPRDIKSIRPELIRIQLRKDKLSVKEIIEKAVKVNIVSPLILVKVDKNGKGEVVQKSAFTADEGNYVSVGMQAGG